MGEAEEGAARMTRSKSTKTALTTPAQKRANSDAVRAAIADVLLENGNRWMSATEIAQEINRRALCLNPDGVDVSVQHVGRQTRNYSNIFERSGCMARLREETASVEVRDN